MRRFSTGLLISLIIGLLLAGSSFALADNAIKLIVNGKELTGDLQLISYNDHVYIPAKALAESLGATVSWDGANNAVIVNAAGYSAPTVQNMISSFDTQTFININNEVVAALGKIDALLKQDTISENEYNSILAVSNSINDKIRGWKELSQYTTIKSEFFQAILDGGKCCLTKKSFTDSDYSSILDTLNQEYNQYSSNYEKDKMGIQAEKLKLQNLGY